MAVYNLQAVYIGQDQVRPKVAVTGVSLNTNSITFTTAGQTYQLLATVTPNNATDQSVTWSSSNTSIVTVSATGLATCVTPGSATITVTTNDGGFTATCNVAQANTSYDLTNSTLESRIILTDGYDNMALASNGLSVLSGYAYNGEGYVKQYTLNTSYRFDTSSLTHTEQISTGISNQISNVSAIYNPLGDKLYVMEYSYYYKISYLHEYSLSTPFDISTKTLIYSQTFSGMDLSGFRIVDHGTKLLATRRGPTEGGVLLESRLMKATFSTAWDITTLSSFSQELVFNSGMYYVDSLAISPDGTRFYVTRDNTYNGYIYQYHTSTPYDFANATLEYTKTMNSNIVYNNSGGDVHPNNGKLYFCMEVNTQSGTQNEIWTYAT